MILFWACRRPIPGGPEGVVNTNRYILTPYKGSSGLVFFSGWLRFNIYILLRDETRNSMGQSMKNIQKLPGAFIYIYIHYISIVKNDWIENSAINHKTRESWGNVYLSLKSRSTGRTYPTGPWRPTAVLKLSRPSHR